MSTSFLILKEKRLNRWSHITHSLPLNRIPPSTNIGRIHMAPSHQVCWLSTLISANFCIFIDLVFNILGYPYRPLIAFHNQMISISFWNILDILHSRGDIWCIMYEISYTRIRRAFSVFGPLLTEPLLNKRGTIYSCNQYVNCISKKMNCVLFLCIQHMNECEPLISGQCSNGVVRLVHMAQQTWRRPVIGH